ncbi:hypothetical protein LLS1_28420 [Leifsonia sp. LS1]|uniref:hypothetical protein n=1 Tax=Leifsonia sp. LS1 TaxID=2828483 RepID=UPI001CFD861B|nr:hypothetical protein [Leifsonia sp. LS1]GIT81173.1 hypothetical protein LLS1_28420 [Leifsonia sp. LS1]
MRPRDLSAFFTKTIRSATTHPALSAAAAAAVLVVAASGIAVPLAAAATAHDAAMDQYRATVHRLDALGLQLDEASRELDDSRDRVTALREVVDTLRNSPEGVLPAEHHSLLDAASTALSTALRLPQGERPTAPETTALPSMSTADVLDVEHTLRRQAARESRWLATTMSALSAAKTERALASTLLQTLVAGAPADGDRAAVSGISTYSASFLETYPRADEQSRSALAATAQAAAIAANAGASVASELVTFVARAQAVRDSQEAADRAAAEAAARAAEEASRSQAPGSHDSGASGGSGSGGPNGAGSHPLPPPPDFTLIAHNPQVYANGYYLPGCVGVPSYTLQAANHGFQIISLDHEWAYRYETFSTPDGWGVTVYDCSGAG